MSQKKNSYFSSASARRERSQSAGFTLIELLVVISIIGLLSSIVLASLTTARTKGLDAARISDVQSIKVAMELYYSDNNAYPQFMSAQTGYGIANLDTYLIPKYIKQIPAILVADGDQFAWQAGGYGLYVYTAAGGRCKTGVNMNGSWWSVADCNY